MWAFVSKVMSLLFNTLFRFVIAFFPKGLPWWLRPKEQVAFNFMAAVTLPPTHRAYLDLDFVDT